MRISSLEFDIQYLLGRTPWDTEQTPPEVIEMVESGGIAPGRALDLGCGSGTNCIYLARQGWQAVGVDFSAVAIWRARCKARRANAACRFFRSDVTDLTFLDPAFDLLLDIGCLHAVPVARRQAYAAEAIRLMRPGGQFMLYAFTHRPEGRSPNGVSPDEVRDLFSPAFTVERQVGGDDPTGPAAAWYWLKKV